MKAFLSFIFLLATLSAAENVKAQVSEKGQPVVLPIEKNYRADSLPADKYRPGTLSFKSVIAPSAMILYGAAALGNNALHRLDLDIKDAVYLDHPHGKIHIDNYLQYAPAASVYLLNIAGIKGRNNFRDRTLLFLVSNIFLNVIVQPVKDISHQWRPDSSDYKSFPSGHAAEAFANAEFLRQEFKDVSPWIGVAGYAMAVATGYLRTYNNRHWFSNVVAGAGIGILSTKLAYWVYPKISSKLFESKKSRVEVDRPGL